MKTFVKLPLVRNERIVSMNSNNIYMCVLTSKLRMFLIDSQSNVKEVIE